MTKIEDDAAYAIKTQKKAAKILADIRAGKHIWGDIRAVGELLDGKWDQDFPTALLELCGHDAGLQMVLYGTIDRLNRELAYCKGVHELDHIELKRAQDAYFKLNGDVCETLGRVLGYPWIKDDQKNFPGSTEADGVCVGEHVAESIAGETAAMIVKLQAELTELKARDEKTYDSLLEAQQDRNGAIRNVMKLREENARLACELEDAHMDRLKAQLLAGGFFSGTNEVERICVEHDTGELSLIGIEYFRAKVDKTCEAMLKAQRETIVRLQAESGAALTERQKVGETFLTLVHAYTQRTQEYDRSQAQLADARTALSLAHDVFAGDIEGLHRDIIRLQGEVVEAILERDLARELLQVTNTHLEVANQTIQNFPNRPEFSKIVR